MYEMLNIKQVITLTSDNIEWFLLYFPKVQIFDKAAYTFKYFDTMLCFKARHISKLKHSFITMCRIFEVISTLST